MPFFSILIGCPLCVQVVEDLEAKLASLHGLQESVQDKDRDLQRYQVGQTQLKLLI